ncbi:MAG: hypothetical protein RDA78_23295 [Roseibium sp.]|uniref:hypothetical protein n=1 Tax=Roseibium sp. TaxID=1936156 RepID=UPI003D9C29A8
MAKRVFRIRVSFEIDGFLSSGGWLVWKELPALPIVTGSLIIVGSGLVALNATIVTGRNRDRQEATE